jgi:hypothetical protein
MKTNFNIEVDLADISLSEKILGQRIGKCVVKLSIDVEMDDQVYERAAIRFERRIDELVEMLGGSVALSDDDDEPVLNGSSPL